MDVLIKKPERFYLDWIELESLDTKKIEEAIGGPLEEYPYIDILHENGISLIVNGRAKENGEKTSFIIIKDLKIVKRIYGAAIFVGVDEDGNYIPITTKQILLVKDMFKEELVLIVKDEGVVRTMDISVS